MFDAKLSLCFLGLALQHRLASGPLFTSENAPTRLNFLPQNQVEFMQSSSIFAATRTASTVTISPTMASESPEQAPAQGQAEGQAADSKPVSEKVPPKQKPQYTCPDGKDRFLCADCGGAKNVVASKESGEANAECIGVGCAFALGARGRERSLTNTARRWHVGRLFMLRRPGRRSLWVG